VEHDQRLHLRILIQQYLIDNSEVHGPEVTERLLQRFGAEVERHENIPVGFLQQLGFFLEAELGHPGKDLG
jgi:hypothetical protein